MWRGIDQVRDGEKEFIKREGERVLKKNREYIFNDIILFLIV
jgi:hypothetical protein